MRPSVSLATLGLALGIAAPLAAQRPELSSNVRRYVSQDTGSFSDVYRSGPRSSSA